MPSLRFSGSDGSAQVVSITTGTTPPFLNGLTKRWNDPVATADPLAALKWCCASLQNSQPNNSIQYPDTVLTGSHPATPGRLSRVATGGPGNKPYYHFWAPQGDQNWSSPPSGRASIDYPKGSPGGTIPAHPGPPGAFFMYEGRRQVFTFSLRLPSPWDVSKPSWRVLHQWKQNEWADSTGTSPALALEQRAGNYIVTQLGGPIVWSTTAAGTVGNWVNWAIDVTFSASSSTGKLKVYADFNNDGTYEYASSQISLATLKPRPGGGAGYESMWSIGLYEGVGGDTIDHADLAIWG